MLRLRLTLPLLVPSLSGYGFSLDLDQSDSLDLKSIHWNSYIPGYHGFSCSTDGMAFLSVMQISSQVHFRRPLLVRRFRQLSDHECSPLTFLAII